MFMLCLLSNTSNLDVYRHYTVAYFLALRHNDVMSVVKLTVCLPIAR